MATSKKDLKNAFSGISIQGSALTLPREQRPAPVRPPSYMGTPLSTASLKTETPQAKHEEKVLHLTQKNEAQKKQTAVSPKEPKEIASSPAVIKPEPAPTAEVQTTLERVNKIESLLRVNVFLDKAEKKAAEDLAEELQLRKSRARMKGEGRLSQERITGNTVIRVALKHFLANFELQDFDLVDNEAELLGLVAKRAHK